MGDERELSSSVCVGSDVAMCDVPNGMMSHGSNVIMLGMLLSDALVFGQTLW